MSLDKQCRRMETIRHGTNLRVAVIAAQWTTNSGRVSSNPARTASQSVMSIWAAS